MFCQPFQFDFEIMIEIKTDLEQILLKERQRQWIFCKLTINTSLAYNYKVEIL
jgi:hypothetical protein